MAKLTFERVKRELARVDPGLKPGMEEWVIAALLLSSASVGPNIRRLARFTGFPTITVRTWAHTFRQKGLWRGARVVGNEWFEKDGGIAFALDCAVAKGLLERTSVAA